MHICIRAESIEFALRYQSVGSRWRLATYPFLLIAKNRLSLRHTYILQLHKKRP